MHDNFSLRLCLSQLNPNGSGVTALYSPSETRAALEMKLSPTILAGSSLTTEAYKNQLGQLWGPLSTCGCATARSVQTVSLRIILIPGHLATKSLTSKGPGLTDPELCHCLTQTQNLEVKKTLWLMQWTLLPNNRALSLSERLLWCLLWQGTAEDKAAVSFSPSCFLCGTIVKHSEWWLRGGGERDDPLP